MMHSLGFNLSSLRKTKKNQLKSIFCGDWFSLFLPNKIHVCRLVWILATTCLPCPFSPCSTTPPKLALSCKRANIGGMKKKFTKVINPRPSPRNGVWWQNGPNSSSESKPGIRFRMFLWTRQSISTGAAVALAAAHAVGCSPCSSCWLSLPALPGHFYTPPTLQQARGVTPHISNRSTQYWDTAWQLGRIHKRTILQTLKDTNSEVQARSLQIGRTSSTRQNQEITKKCFVSLKNPFSMA